MDNRILEIGGPEFLSTESVVTAVIKKIKIKRRLLHAPPPFLRLLTVFLEYILPSSPISVYWLDYFATNRTCALDTIPRVFNIMPSRFSQRLEFLEERNWRREFWKNSLRRKR
jgi:hypothetical protein